MNTGDMYTREKFAKIKQEEIIRDARHAQMYPISLRAILANRRLSLAIGAVIVLAALITLANALPM